MDLWLTDYYDRKLIHHIETTCGTNDVANVNGVTYINKPVVQLQINH